MASVGLFLRWLLLLGGVATGSALVRYRRGDAHALRTLALLVGPILAALIWLHGVIFHLPENIAVLDDYGFFGYSFRLRDADGYTVPFGWLVLGLSLPAVVWLLRWVPLWRRLAAHAQRVEVASAFDNPKREFALAVGFWFQIAIALWLHAIPDLLFRGFERLGSWMSDDLRVVSVVLAVSVLPAGITRLLLRSELLRLKQGTRRARPVSARP